MTNMHPTFAQALAPFAPPQSEINALTEAELIAGDIENNIDKADKAHRAQDAEAMRLQLRYGTVDSQ